MHFTDLDQIFLTHGRLTACINVHISTKLFTLSYNRINGLKAQIQFMSILSCPASGTVQIAGTGRIQKDRPGYITVVLCCHLILSCTSFQAGIDNKILEKYFSYLRIKIINTHDQLIPVAVFIFNRITDGISLACIPVIW